MTYRDLDSFYREDPRRGRSREFNFGVWPADGSAYAPCGSKRPASCTRLP